MRPEAAAQKAVFVLLVATGLIIVGGCAGRRLDVARGASSSVPTRDESAPAGHWGEPAPQWTLISVGSDRRGGASADDVIPSQPLSVDLPAGASAAADHSGSHHGSGHHFHRNHVAIFAGGMANKHELSPALGLSYERRFTKKWGAEVGADFTFGDHERTALFATGVTFRPFEHFKLMTGPGMELAETNKGKKKGHFLWGVGAAYEVELKCGFSLSPTVYIDFIGETGTNVSIGLALGKGF